MKTGKGKVRRKLVSCLCAFALVVSQIVLVPMTPALADETSFTVDGIVYTVLDSSAKTVRIGDNSTDAGNGLENKIFPSSHELTIESQVTNNGETWTVSEVGTSAFEATSSDDYLDKITIKANLTSVGQRAFAGKVTTPFKGIVLDGGSIGTMYANALSDVATDLLDYPDVTTLTAIPAVTGSEIKGVAIPMHSAKLINLENLENLCVLYNRAPYSWFRDSSFNSNILSNNNNVKVPCYYWVSDSKSITAEKSARIYPTTEELKAAIEYRAMAVLSEDPWSVSVSGKSDYSCNKNVDFGFEDGATFAAAPTFTLKCTTSTTQTVSGVESWNLVEGKDYKAVYYDSEGTQLPDRPTANGSYGVEFVGNGLNTWGTSKRMSYTISSVTIGTITVENVVANSDGSVVSPEISVVDTEGNAIDSSLLDYVYKNNEGTVIAASDLKDAGSYTVTVTGKDANRIKGSASATFAIIRPDKVLTSAEQAADLVETGDILVPSFAVKDAAGRDVADTNYSVSYVNESNEPVSAANLKAAGTYQATITAIGTEYGGTVTCSLYVYHRAIEGLQVSLKRNVYDYIPSPQWADNPDQNNQKRYGTDEEIVYEGEEVLPALSVVLDGSELVEGDDYKIVAYNNKGNSKASETEFSATFSIQLIGKYEEKGIAESPDYKYTIKKDQHEAYTYKGVRFSYAIDRNGDAVITGLDIGQSITAETADFAGGYTSAWDNETITIPSMINDGSQTYAVKRVASRAFAVPSRSAASAAGSKDILNGAKKLIIEEGIVEVGQSAFPCSNIEEISLPEGLETIRANAFSGACAHVKNIVIPRTVVRIGSAAFGENSDKSAIETIEFEQPSQFTGIFEPEIIGSTSGDYRTQGEQWRYLFDGGAVNKDGATQASLTSLTLPASFRGVDQLFYDMYNLDNVYYMADKPSSTEPAGNTGAFGMIGRSSVGKMTLWGWDVEGSYLPTVATSNNTFKQFKPFAVLDGGYDYTNAYNEETGVCDATKHYDANIAFGTPKASINSEGVVTIDWDLQEHYVLSDYAWTPEKDADFTVSYTDAAGNPVDEITSAGTYTATLTGNGKNCFGTMSTQIHVQGLELGAETATVSFEDADGNATVGDGNQVNYTGSALEPAVMVKYGDTLLEAGTEYDLAYTDNIKPGTATVNVTGKGVYEGTISKNFEVVLSSEDAAALKAVEDAIAALPANVASSDDAAKVYAVQSAYEGLSGALQTLISDESKGALDTAVAAADKVVAAADKAAAEAKAKKVTSVTVNAKTVTDSAISKAIKKAGGNAKYVKTVVLGKKVKKVKAKALKKYAKVKTLTVKTTKLTKKGVRNALKGSKVKTVKVKVSSKKATNKKYVKKYKKIFTKANAGKKVTVKR